MAFRLIIKEIPVSPGIADGLKKLTATCRQPDGTDKKKHFPDQEGF
jgi:hypothetical protein